MREILFRAKRIDNGEWVEGWYQPPIVGIHCDGRKESLGASLSIIGNYGFLEDVYIIPETVGQFTGLTDKNGKKIFEEDIVRDAQNSLFGKVVYATPQDGFDGMAGFMVDDVDDGLQNYNGFWHQVEVVGNIHDNPELIGSAEC